MVKDVRMAELSLGKTTYLTSERSRSAYVLCYWPEDMKAGSYRQERSLHPSGLRPAPKYLKDILGKNVNRDLEKGTRFALEYVNG